MSNYLIRVLSKDEQSDALKLFNDVFHLDCDWVFWSKKHFDNPFGESVIFGVFDDDKLIAINGFWRVDYIYRDVLYRGFESCESAVDPNYRHQGLFSRLINEAVSWATENEYDFMIGLPNQYSYPGFVKLGWETTRERTVYTRIDDVGGWIKKKNKNNIRLYTDFRLIMLCLKNAIVGLFKKYEKDVIVSEINQSEFIDRCEDKSQNYVVCKYDRKFLDWAISGDGKYYILSDKEGEIALVAVSDKNVKYLEYSTDNVDRIIKSLDILCSEIIKNETQSSLLVDKDIGEALNKVGFISAREVVRHDIVKVLSDKMKENVSDEGVWRIHFIEEA